MKAVIFDVFGTLLNAKGNADPFRELIKMATQNGICVPRDISHTFMSHAWTLRECAAYLSLSISDKEHKRLKKMLDEYLGAVELFPEVEQVLTQLRGRNIKIAACSNLALPYGGIVKSLLPGLDAYVLSYEVGNTKPDPSIYQLAVTALGVEAEATCMIGDSLRCDKRGPETIGVKGYWLNRNGCEGADLTTLLESVALFSED